METSSNCLTANALTEYSSNVPGGGSGTSSPVSSVPSVFKHEDGSPDVSQLLAPPPVCLFFSCFVCLNLG